jgi:hypothetical protein
VLHSERAKPASDPIALRIELRVGHVPPAGFDGDRSWMSVGLKLEGCWKRMWALCIGAPG